MLTRHVLPGATPQNPGLKIRFVGAAYLEQFPDQFRPYLHFGCDMASPFKGTLFRFPLRTREAAAKNTALEASFDAKNSTFCSQNGNNGPALCGGAHREPRTAPRRRTGPRPKPQILV